MSRIFDRRLLAVALALAVAGVLLIGAQTRASRLSADFTIDYSAGVLVREGRLAAIYDQAQLAEVLQRFAPNGAIDPRLPFNKPLAAALPYAVLSLLPLEVAFRVWQAISAGLLLLMLLVLQRAQPLGNRALGFGTIGLLAAVPTAATFDEGQITPLLALGAALMIASLRSKNLSIALAAGALLAVKPQYLPAYLVVCLAARAWRPLLAGAVGGGVVVLSPLVGGWHNVVAMAHQAAAANYVVDVRLNEAWIGVLGALLPAAALTGVAIATFLLVHAVLCWLAWRRPTNLIAFAALAGVLAALVSPHALPHDLLILAVPAWLAVGLYRAGSLPNPMPALVLADLALLIDLKGIGVPVAPIVITAALAWLVWTFRQRAASQQQPRVVRAA
ncbi:MAG TPA: glycosyltransferase 87 family protein [Candidatus Angelobacter sp.]|jgi:hypothetical protein|nr:glycosyltransferase 87 family protein [Candidatus Angelobacter sp.]